MRLGKGLHRTEMRQGNGAVSPRLFLPTVSHVSLPSPGNRAHFVYGIACDSGCIWDLKFCPSGAWEHPETPRKVLLVDCGLAVGGLRAGGRRVWWVGVFQKSHVLFLETEPLVF